MPCGHKENRSLTMKHILSPLDLTDADRDLIFKRALWLKERRIDPVHAGKRVGGLYFNPSLRTRVSWEGAADAVGCSCQTLNAGQDMWAMEMDPLAVMDKDRQECVVEAAGVLGRFFDVLGVRSFPKGGPWEEEREEPVLKAFVEHSNTNVVSLEGAMHHPCQGLADHLTLREEFGPYLEGLPVVLMWGWHPRHLPMAVPNTFALQSVLAGASLTIAHPEGWDLDPLFMKTLNKEAEKKGRPVRISHSKEEALKGAKAVYVKAWGRLSTPGEPAPDSLRSWMLDDELWMMTENAKVMHCLPTRRNVEIASSVLDSPRSIVLRQAENRLWAQAGLIDLILRGSNAL